MFVVKLVKNWFLKQIIKLINHIIVTEHLLFVFKLFLSFEIQISFFN